MQYDQLWKSDNSDHKETFLCLHTFLKSSVHVWHFRFQGEPHNTYLPFNKDWIKERIYIQLRKQAAAK